MKKLISITLALALCLSLLAGCGSAAPAETEAPAAKKVETPVENTGEPETVKIGVITSLTGSNASFGEYVMRGAEMAVENINNNGGIEALGGAKIEMIVADTLSDSTQMKTIAEKMISENNLTALVVPGGTPFTMAVQPSSEKYEIPVLTMASNDSVVNEGYKYTVLYNSLASLMGPLQIQFLKKIGTEYDFDYSKVGVLYVDNEFGKSVADGNIAKIEASEELEMVFCEAYPTDISDATSIITAAKASGAEVLYLTADHGTMKTIFMGFDTVDYHPILMGGGSGMVDGSFPEVLGDDCLGVLSIAASAENVKSVAGNERFAQLYKDYMAKYGDGPAESFGPVLSMFFALEQAMEATASTDPKVINEALHTMEFELPLQTTREGCIYKADETGYDEETSFVIVQWQKTDAGTYVMNAVYPDSVVLDSNYIDYSNK